MSFTDGTPLIEQQKLRPAEPFEAMAQTIRHQEDTSPFGGAVVAVPPGGHQMIFSLNLDPTANVAQFWATLKSRCEMQLAELSEAEARAKQGRW